MDEDGLQWTQMGLDKLIWKACSTYNGQHQERTYFKTSYKHGKQQKMEEL